MVIDAQRGAVNNPVLQDLGGQVRARHQNQHTNSQFAPFPGGGYQKYHTSQRDESAHRNGVQRGRIRPEQERFAEADRKPGQAVKVLSLDGSEGLLGDNRGEDCADHSRNQPKKLVAG